MSSEIINTYDQLCAAGGGVAVIYRRNGGRAVMPPWVEVMRVNEQCKIVRTAEPNAPWYVHGYRVFNLNDADGDRRQQRKVAEQRAILWCRNEFGIAGDFVRNGFGDLVPADIQQRFPLRKRK